MTYTGCPQKSITLDFHYFDILKNIAYLISSDKTLSSEKNDTKILIEIFVFWLNLLIKFEEENYSLDYVLRNDNIIKTTQPISIILVSFFSEGNVFSDEI